MFLPLHAPHPVFTRHRQALLFSVGLGALLPFPLQPLKSVLLGLTAPWLRDNSWLSKSF